MKLFFILLYDDRIDCTSLLLNQCTIGDKKFAQNFHSSYNKILRIQRSTIIYSEVINETAHLLLKFSCICSILLRFCYVFNKNMQDIMKKFSHLQVDIIFGQKLLV